MERPEEEGRQTVSFDLPRREEKPARGSIVVRMPPEDKAGLQRLAKAGGLSLSAFCCEILQRVLRQAEGGGRRP